MFKLDDDASLLFAFGFELFVVEVVDAVTFIGLLVGSSGEQPSAAVSMWWC